MIFKRLSAILIIALMLPFLWVATDAQGQTVVCPGIEYPDGWFRFNVVSTDSTVVGSEFTAGLYGSLEATSSGVVGDVDWLYNDDSDTGDDGNSTDSNSDSQIVTWWSQKEGRNTWVQYTNEESASGQGSVLGTDVTGAPLPLGVHVQIFGEDCQEIRDFCDFYTPKDTHVYNLGDLVTNLGQDISEGPLQGREGFMTITPVVNCGSDDRAIQYSQEIISTVRIIDTVNDVDYGVNAWHRDVNVNGTCTTLSGGQNGAATPGNANILDGVACELEPLEPSVLSQNFKTIGDGPASDVVLFSFTDVYNDSNPAVGYQPTPAATAPQYFPDIFDDEENLESCPAIQGCFVRVGVNDALPVSEDFVAPTPEPTPTPEPSPTPTPEPTDTTGGDGGDGGGCTVATAVTASTAAANFLLPLLPLAGAYGIRRFRRRNK